MFNKTKLALQLAALPILALPLAAQAPPTPPPPYLLSNLAGNAAQNVIVTAVQICTFGTSAQCTFPGINPDLLTHSVGGNSYDATGDFFFLFAPFDPVTGVPLAPATIQQRTPKGTFSRVADVPVINSCAPTGPATFTSTSKGVDGRAYNVPHNRLEVLTSNNTTSIQLAPMSTGMCVNGRFQPTTGSFSEASTTTFAIIGVNVN
jgi:hypothetical protein